MGKQKGSTKTGGRKEGTPNKRSSEFRDSLLSEGIDIVKEFVDIYKRQTNDEIKLKMIIRSLDFCFPKFKPMGDSDDKEHSLTSGLDLQKLSDQDLQKLIDVYEKYGSKEHSVELSS